MSYNLGNTDAITYDGAEVDKLTLDGEIIWESGGVPAQSAKMDDLYWYQLYGGNPTSGISNPTKISLGGYIDGQDGSNGGYYNGDVAVSFNHTSSYLNAPKNFRTIDVFGEVMEFMDVRQLGFKDISTWIPQGSNGLKSLRISADSRDVDEGEAIMVDDSGRVFSKSKSGKLRGDGVLQRRDTFEKFKVQQFDGGHPKAFLHNAWTKSSSQISANGARQSNAPGIYGYSADALTIESWSGFSSSTNPSGLYQEGGGVEFPATGDITNAHSITGYHFDKTGNDDFQGYFINSDEGVFATHPHYGGERGREAPTLSKYGAIQGFAWDDPVLWSGTTFINGLILDPLSKVTFLGLSYPGTRITFSKQSTTLKSAIEDSNGSDAILETRQYKVNPDLLSYSMYGFFPGGYPEDYKSSDFDHYSNMCGSFGAQFLYRHLDGSTHQGWYGFDWYGGFRFSESAKKVFNAGNKRLLGYLPFKGDLYSPTGNTGYNLVLLIEGDYQQSGWPSKTADRSICSKAYLSQAGSNSNNQRHPRSGQIFIKPSGSFKVNDNYTYSWSAKSDYWHWHDTHVEKWNSLMTEDGLIPKDETFYVRASRVYEDIASPGQEGMQRFPSLPGDTSTSALEDGIVLEPAPSKRPGAGSYQVDLASRGVGSYAMVVGDTFWAWGANWHGELGIGDYAHNYPAADDGEWIGDGTFREPGNGLLKKRLLTHSPYNPSSVGEWKDEPLKDESKNYTHFARHIMWGRHLYQPVYVKYDHDGNEIKNIKDIAVCNNGILILKTDGTLLASGRFWKPIAYCGYEEGFNLASSRDVYRSSLGPILTTNTPSLKQMGTDSAYKITVHPIPIYPSRFEDTGLVDIEAISASAGTALIVQKSGSKGCLWELGYEMLTSTQNINSNKTGTDVTGL